MSEEDDGWGGQSFTPTSYASQKRSPEQETENAKETAKSPFKPHYSLSFTGPVEIPRLASSLFPDGYGEGAFVALAGVGGCGKSRLALQEAFFHAREGNDVLYIYNESEQSKFDMYATKIAREVGVISEDQIRKVKFWDVTELQLGTANYAAMESFAERVYVKNVKYWLENEATSPVLVVFDSFSNICRQFVPQMPIFHQYITHGLTSIYSEHHVTPVTLIIHQKSLSPREAHTDSVVGGYGINHEGDMTILFKVYDVDVWGERNFGWKQGTKHYTACITKDRYQRSEFPETEVILKNGQLTLASTIANRVAETKRFDSQSKAITSGQQHEGDW
jgi:KaiC/GvpD/RAD55 family RecA-like ATPase